MRTVDTLVIGAGPSGLSLAFHLGGNTLVLEKEPEVGGLCRSIEHQGGVFDIGGHSFHTPHPEVRDLVERLMAGRWCWQQRDARVYTHQTLIPYPFQRFFDRIPDPAVVEECRRGLSEVRSGERATNFEEYLLARFGSGVAKHFMLPYNRKLWARDLKRMSCEWAGERVAAPQGVPERFDTTGGQRMPLQPETVVGYPADGGYAEIYKSFVPHLPALELNQEIERIDPLEKIAVTATGGTVRWRRLVSTIPLPALLRMVEGTPDALIGAVDRLEYMSLDLLLILVGDPLPDAPQRLYVADPAVPPHKIAFNHTSSESLRRRPVHAITAEIAYSPDKPLQDPQALEKQTIDFLVDIALLRSAADVIWTDHLDIRYAYPVYTHQRLATVQAAKEYLEPLSIHTLGRFGEWEYVNSDRCIKKGMDLARALQQERLPSEASAPRWTARPAAGLPAGRP